jgi:hypothetical protein
VTVDRREYEEHQAAKAKQSQIDTLTTAANLAGEGLPKCLADVVTTHFTQWIPNCDGEFHLVPLQVFADARHLIEQRGKGTRG